MIQQILFWVLANFITLQNIEKKMNVLESKMWPSDHNILWELADFKREEKKISDKGQHHV